MKGEIPNSQQRKFVILERLMNQEHLSYKKLSEEYFVSRSSIANDISYIKKLLAREGLKMTFDNSGTYLKAAEAQFQKVIKQIILAALSDERRNYFIDEALLSHISAIFYQLLRERKLDISESYGQNIVVSITVMVQRGRAGKYIEIQERDKLEELISGFNIYPFTHDLLQKIEASGIYQFSLEELQHLSYIIAGSGWNIFESQDSVPLKFRKETERFIKRVCENIDIAILSDGRLQEELAVHLYQLLLRTEAQNSVHNPLTEEMKKRYPALYGIVWLALQDFDKQYPLELSDDELGFIVIHFQAAIERVKRVNKILLVCPNGVGASSYISAKIAHILPSSTSIETVSVTHLENVDMSKVAFVVTTMDLPKLEKPVVKVTTMLTAKDMKAIMNQFIDFIEEEKKQDLLLENVKKVDLFDHIYFLDLKTREEVLNYLIAQHEFDDARQKANFMLSLWESEKIGTYLENGFALPHGSPKYVNKKNISAVVLNNPISWGGKEVDIIVLLMVPENYKTMEPVMKMIIRGMSDKEWFISKMIEERNI
ncbi:BglG family transcription antiterminator [Lactococcus ileimucosae]|uniref:BglG family transcription antiterminator n=1 Tax=Lactococcus ileimucosae TaxID=2941329 RepID=UPI002043CF17|nr:PTS sugar transporter subunit IIA [Lactococcus ileimucosae]